MGRLAQLCGLLAPGATARYLLKRRALEEAQRLYEAASPSQYRRSIINDTSADGALNLAGDRLRQLARHLDENHDLTVSVFDDLVNNTIGTGIIVSPMVRRPAGELADDVNRDLAELWDEWAARPETTNQLDFGSAERLLARSKFRDGEAFVKLVTNLRFRYPTRVPLTLELLEADFVPFDLDDDAANLLQGIEVNEWSAPTFYHVYDRHPGDPGFSYRAPNDTRRVPASRMLHLKFTRRLRQRRGVPIIHAVINRMRDLQDYEQSERIAAKVAADLTFFIRKNEHYQGATTVNEYKNRQWRLAAGTGFELMPGEDIATIKSERPNTGLEAFRNAMLRAVAGGTSTRFSSVARDYNGTYSAQRQELVEGAVAYRAESANLIRAFHRPVYERFIDQVLASRALNLRGIDRATMYRADFQPPSLPWIDPQKEADAWLKLIEGKLESRSEIIRRRGRDPRKVAEEITAEQSIEAFAPQVAPAMVAPADDEGGDEPDETAAEENAA
jgi:lambda family phage portal protein